jgi:gamma-glutamyl-gamma-aminobutyrate hydrolase PuuD
MPMDRPIILISPDISAPGAAPRERIQLNLEYQESVAMAGGTPIVASPLSSASEMASFADAWLITGGDDLPGEMFGQQTHEMAKLMPERRIEAEKALFAAFSRTDKPILGICFGMQFLSVMNGAAMHQHLPEIVCHEKHTNGISCVSATPGSRLAKIVGTEPFQVGCFHHQAAMSAPNGWSVAAKSDDDVIEAIEESSTRFRFGLQWHPERTADSTQSKAIFEAFVNAASRR